MDSKPFCRPSLDQKPLRAMCNLPSWYLVAYHTSNCICGCPKIGHSMVNGHVYYSKVMINHHLFGGIVPSFMYQNASLANGESFLSNKHWQQHKLSMYTRRCRFSSTLLLKKVTKNHDEPQKLRSSNGNPGTCR